jgi:hypothetical protein
MYRSRQSRRWRWLLVRVRLRLPRCDLCGRKGRRNWHWTRTHLWSCLCGNSGCRITAGAKADISLYCVSLYCVSPPTISLLGTNVHGTDEDENVEDRDGWETILMDGRTIDIRTRRSARVRDARHILLNSKSPPCTKGADHAWFMQ